jgi:hypothetical protein
VFDYPTRALLQFDLTDISNSIDNGSITTPSTVDYSGSKFYLRLYEAEGDHN